MQRILDPRHIPSGCPACAPPAALPDKVRQLGHLPRVDRLLPGDLILISPLAPTWTQKVIRKAQETGGYSPSDAQWTHAAVYLGTRFAICEATALKGVRQGSLLDSLANHLVRVRRDYALDSDTRWRMALEAALQIGTRYGLVSGAKFGVRALKGLHRPQNKNTQSTSALNCSELFADAHRFATGRTLQWQHPGREVSPAFLSFVPELTDVAMEWQRI